jgi:YD repeat-containing protein
MRREALGLFLFLLITSPSFGQDFQWGFVPFMSYDTHPFDSVNLFNGNIVANIPIISYPQRGTLPDVGFHLIYNNANWFPECYASGMDVGCQWDTSSMGFQVVPDNELTPIITSVCCETCVYGVHIEDSNGAVHPAGFTTSGNTMALTADASGILEALPISAPGPVITTDRSGITHTYDYGDEAPISWKDPTGNTVSISMVPGSITIASYTDSISRPIPAPPGVLSAPQEGCDIEYYGSGCISALPGCYAVDYPGFAGGTSTITYCYANFSISTSFGAPDDPPSFVCDEYSGTQSLLQSVTLANGTSWTFSYDSYGDLVSVNLPTGGQIAYSWQWNWVGGTPSCSSGITGWHTVTSKTVNPGSSPQTWHYAYSYNYSSPYLLLGATTTVTDPDENTTVHTFGNGDGTYTY